MHLITYCELLFRVQDKRLRLKFNFFYFRQGVNVVCLFVSLCVCQQNYGKTTDPIFMKPGRRRTCYILERIQITGRLHKIFFVVNIARQAFGLGGINAIDLKIQ